MLLCLGVVEDLKDTILTVSNVNIKDGLAGAGLTLKEGQVVVLVVPTGDNEDRCTLLNSFLNSHVVS